MAQQAQTVPSLRLAIPQMFVQLFRRNDPYTHFSQQLHNKLTWLIIFYYFFTKKKENKKKKNYYQPHQLVVGLL
jgi:hypothetical protein